MIVLHEKGVLFRFSVVVTLLLFSGQFLCAQAPEQPLQSKMTAYLVTQDADKGEQLIATEQILPGQTIEYALDYSNVSERDLTEISIIGPIPMGTFYLAGSAQPSKDSVPQFSVDDAQSFHLEPVKYMVKLEDGTEVEKIATADMYTQIRWQINRMQAGEKLTLKYRVQVH
ncbi:MAG: hypothetical protein GX946_02450 [Oligosphaeraceae bacterium]|nr:hypothetical protein [Oligosphaeraceae bacterium]